MISPAQCLATNPYIKYIDSSHPLTPTVLGFMPMQQALKLGIQGENHSFRSYPRLMSAEPHNLMDPKTKKMMPNGGGLFGSMAKFGAKMAWNGAKNSVKGAARSAANGVRGLFSRLAGGVTGLFNKVKSTVFPSAPSRGEEFRQAAENLRPNRWEPPHSYIDDMD